jgi:PAS domain S-box-containing protein
MKENELDITECRRAEMALLRLASILESSDDAIVGTDVSGTITDWNKGAERLFGYSASEAIGKNVSFLGATDDYAEGRANREKVLRGEAVRPCDTVCRRKDGTRVDVSLTISPIVDAEGRIIGSSGIARDITERKVADSELRDAQDRLCASEERLRLAQWAAHIGTFDLNLRTGVNTWTPELEAMYGLPPGSFGGTQTAFENLIHPEDRARVIELNNWALKTGQPTTGEWRVVWPDGCVHWIAGRWQVLMSDTRKPSRMIGVNIDVTESKRVEQAQHAMNRALGEQTALLRSQEELLRVFVKNVPAAVAMLDRDMRYLQVSDRWSTDYLKGSTEVLGRSHYEIFPDMPERWKEVHRRALQGEILRANEDRWDGQDGSHWARWEVRPWKTPEGVVGGILILTEDITHRKQMEEALSGMTRKLVEAQEQERIRVARELHDDISQRLALLAIELDRVQGKPKDLPSKVRDHIQELQQLTADISSRVYALSHDLHSLTPDSQDLEKGMRSWCREFGKRQKMEIDFKGHDLPSLPQEITVCVFRVLQEALHNAAKHSGAKRIEVQLAEQSGKIHLVVSDAGKGFDIAAATRDRGLGITSMQERVRLAGGTISIDSKPRAGTVVHVCVPFRAERKGQGAGG